MKGMPHITKLVDDLLIMTRNITVKRRDIADKFETEESQLLADYYKTIKDEEDDFLTYINFPIEVLQPLSRWEETNNLLPCSWTIKDADIAIPVDPSNYNQLYESSSHFNLEEPDCIGDINSDNFIKSIVAIRKQETSKAVVSTRLFKKYYTEQDIIYAIGYEDDPGGIRTYKVRRFKDNGYSYYPVDSVEKYSQDEFNQIIMEDNQFPTILSTYYNNRWYRFGDTDIEIDTSSTVVFEYNFDFEQIASLVSGITDDGKVRQKISKNNIRIADISLSNEPTIADYSVRINTDVNGDPIMVDTENRYYKGSNIPSNDFGKLGDIYIDMVNLNDSGTYITYTCAPLFNASYLITLSKNKNLIPDEYRDMVVESMRVYVQRTYLNDNGGRGAENYYGEKNDYYRMLSGLPSVAGMSQPQPVVDMSDRTKYPSYRVWEETTDIEPVIDTMPIFPEGYKYSFRNSCYWNSGMPARSFGNVGDLYIDTSDPDNHIVYKKMRTHIPFIFDLGERDIAIITENGVLPKIRENDPDREYLNYLGSNRIDVVKARNMSNYEILRIGEPNNKYHKQLFISKYEIAKEYVLRRLYNPELFMRHSYYGAYIGLLITNQAMNMCLVTNGQLLNKREYYDENTVKYRLASHGLDVFDDIPLQYRKIIADNIELLIKYKGKDQVFQYIYEMFGFNDVNVYKYYIKKTQKTSDGQLIFNEFGVPEYDIEIIQVPINTDSLTKELIDESNRLDYDTITGRDIYWGVYESDETIKSDLLQYEFNYLNSKYIAINNMYNLTRLNIESTYLMTTMKTLSESANSQVFIQTEFSDNTSSLFDVIIALFYLQCILFGYDSTIVRDPEQIIMLYGFNYNTNLNEIQEIYNKYGVLMDMTNGQPTYNIKSPGENDIIGPADISSYYNHNKEVMDNLNRKRLEVKTWKEHMCYQELYKYLITSQEQKDLYGDNTTYEEVLKERDLELYEGLSTIYNRDTEPPTIDYSLVQDHIDSLIHSIELVIDDKDIQIVLSKMSKDNNKISTYIRKVISVFKSYTVDIDVLRDIYAIDNKYNNNVGIFSELGIDDSPTVSDNVNIMSELGFNEGFHMKTVASIKDEMFIEEFRKDPITGTLSKYRRENDYV